MEEALKQYRAVREDLGWFDRSDVAWLAVRGPDRYTWLQGMVSNDVRRLERGETNRLPACILSPTGHILADITLIDVSTDSPIRRFMGDEPFILIEAPRVRADWISIYLNRFLIMEDAELVNFGVGLLCTSVQGPALERIRPTLAAFEGDAIIVEADHTGSGGVDVYNPDKSQLQFRNNLRHFAPVQVGAEVQEILRIEAGIPKYGDDMDETTLAPEAGLMATHVSLTKGCYVGQEIVARIDSRGHTNRALTGLLVLGDTAPVPGERLFSDDVGADGRETGRVTSVAPFSPAAGGRPVALGYVRHEHRAPGAWLRLGSADSRRMVEIVELPIYRNPAP